MDQEQNHTQSHPDVCTKHICCSDCTRQNETEAETQNDVNINVFAGDLVRITNKEVQNFRTKVSNHSHMIRNSQNTVLSAAQGALKNLHLKINK